jgi:hypothetical protein
MAEGHTKAGKICTFEYVVRVPDLIRNMTEIKSREDVQVDDVWRVLEPYDHCGLVVAVEDVGEGENKKKKISITHCSSTLVGGIEKGVKELSPTISMSISRAKASSTVSSFIPPARLPDNKNPAEAGFLLSCDMR